MNLDQFTQTNLVGVLDRANEILASVRNLTPDMSLQDRLIASMRSLVESGDDWERVSLDLAALELMERRIRAQDSTVEKFPKDWAGGIAQQFVTTQPANGSHVLPGVCASCKCCPKCGKDADCACIPVDNDGTFAGNRLDKLSPRLYKLLADMWRNESNNYEVPDSQVFRTLEKMSTLGMMRMYTVHAINPDPAFDDMQQILDACRPIKKGN